MSGSVYRVTEVIGTSSESWEAAAANAVATAAVSGEICVQRWRRT
jgi:flavin-binding protein dodecin